MSILSPLEHQKEYPLYSSLPPLQATLPCLKYSLPSISISYDIHRQWFPQPSQALPFPSITLSSSGNSSWSGYSPSPPRRVETYHNDIYPSMIYHPASSSSGSIDDGKRKNCTETAHTLPVIHTLGKTEPAEKENWTEMIIAAGKPRNDGGNLQVLCYKLIHSLKEGPSSREDLAKSTGCVFKPSESMSVYYFISHLLFDPLECSSGMPGRGYAQFLRYTERSGWSESLRRGQRGKGRRMQGS